MPLALSAAFHLLKKVARLQSLALLLALAVSARATVGAAIGNAGHVLFLRAIFSADHPLGQYPLKLPLVDGAATAGALSVLRLATTVDEHNGLARWSSGRIALAVGRSDLAVDALSADPVHPWRNSLEAADVIAALSATGRDGAVDALIEASTDQRLSPAQRDAVAALHLSAARRSKATGDGEGELRALRAALSVRPFDLHANHRLLLLTSGDASGERERLRARLDEFPAEAIPLYDERLAEFFTETVAGLVSQGIWGPERAMHVIRYWSWRNPRSAELMALLRRLSDDVPGDTAWDSVLAEHQRRRGRLSPHAATAQQERGQLPPLREEAQPQAHGGSATDSWRGDLQQSVATMLAVPPADLVIGPNLVRDSTFRSLQMTWSDSWATGVATDATNSSSGWPFVVARDTQELTASARIHNLWWPRVNGGEAYRPYGELRGAAFKLKAGWIVVRFRYRVDGHTDDFGLFLLGAPARPGFEPTLTHTVLTPTDGRWVQVLVVGRYAPPDGTAFPLLRNWAAGDAWFSDLSVNEVGLRGRTTAGPACADQACVAVSPG